MFQPAKNRYLIKLKEAEEFTPGGIALPDSARKRDRQAGEALLGTVVAVPDVPDVNDRKALPCWVGDTVAISRFAGSSIELEGSDHRIVHRKEILGVFAEA